MRDYEVVSLMGAPISKKTLALNTHWYYDDSEIQWYVSFRNHDMKVDGWVQGRR